MCARGEPFPPEFKRPIIIDGQAEARVGKKQLRGESANLAPCSRRPLRPSHAGINLVQEPLKYAAARSTRAERRGALIVRTRGRIAGYWPPAAEAVRLVSLSPGSSR
jgi:hypothetical protein